MSMVNVFQCYVVYYSQEFLSQTKKKKQKLHHFCIPWFVHVPFIILSSDRSQNGQETQRQGIVMDLILHGY